MLTVRRDAWDAWKKCKFLKTIRILVRRIKNGTDTKLTISSVYCTRQIVLFLDTGKHIKHLSCHHTALFIFINCFIIGHSANVPQYSVA